MIFHLVDEESWVRAVARGEYAPPPLQSEGFIHLSTQAQVAGTAERFFAGRTDMLVLHVDEAKLTARLKYEPADGQQFPHHYGPLPLVAVTKVQALKDWEP